MRKPFIGVWNIVRFNWHFYVMAATMVVLLLWIYKSFTIPFDLLALFVCVSILVTTCISLIASWYVYDYSKLYDFQWLQKKHPDTELSVLNINAGFDETSSIIQQCCDNVELSVYDFYDPKLHTEVSIKRARTAYPPHHKTMRVKTNGLPAEDGAFDVVVCFLSAHEIRNDDERIIFFKELSRIMKEGGKIYVVEHLRDLNNFTAYTIGFFHFHSGQTWLNTFRDAGLIVEQKEKLNPLITLFSITKNGDTP